MSGLQNYQAATKTTAIYPGVGSGNPQALMYLSNGMAAEAGEVVGKFAKAIRDDNYMEADLTPERREAILAEIGDVLWFAARLCDELDTTLEDVAEANVEKLQGRKARGTLGGDGDVR